MLSLLGLAGFAMAAQRWLAGWPQYVLLGASIGFMLRALYLSAWRGHGPRWSKWIVWGSTAMVALLWWLRL